MTTCKEKLWASHCNCFNKVSISSRNTIEKTYIILAMNLRRSKFWAVDPNIVKIDPTVSISSTIASTVSISSTNWNLCCRFINFNCPQRDELVSLQKEKCINIVFAYFFYIFVNPTCQVDWTHKMRNRIINFTRTCKQSLSSKKQ